MGFVEAVLHHGEAPAPRAGEGDPVAAGPAHMVLLLAIVTHEFAKSKHLRR